ncbi:hypothetical protein J5X98_00240 [Leptothermofonsia sichuanensis E412]|nr:hypothetical protein [Leptothermofonsia sichuanensis]QZZ20983.1 hypothetical protein J5X98_00240 [Leptothermofonsia sichuanensis E412]
MQSAANRPLQTIANPSSLVPVAIRNPPAPSNDIIIYLQAGLAYAAFGNL